MIGGIHTDGFVGPPVNLEVRLAVTRQLYSGKMKPLTDWALVDACRPRFLTLDPGG